MGLFHKFELERDFYEFMNRLILTCKELVLVLVHGNAMKFVDVNGICLAADQIWVKSFDTKAL